MSLLRVTQPHFAYLEPDRSKVFTTARKASDMLARSAMNPDHLPASQSVFLRRLIEVKSAEAPTSTYHQAYLPEMIDFEAFGQSLEGDQSKTLWPPAPLNFDLASHPGVPTHLQPSAGISRTQQNGDDTGRVSARDETGQIGSMPTDLNGWVAANQFPMPGLSLGMGSSFGQDDLIFTQDSFWKSIFEGQVHNQGEGQSIGMV